MRRMSPANIGLGIARSETRVSGSTFQLVSGSYLGIVGGLFDDFRCHPERRPDESVSFAGRVGQLSGDTEIC